MFDLTQYTKVYAPALGNSPKEIEILDKEKFYPIKLSENRMSLTKDGKHSTHASNPVVFPYSQEWYDKLKVVYPDLKPYVVDYRAIIKSILANTKTVACRKSYVNHAEAIKSGALVFVDANTQLSKDAYYVVVNPFTLEVCESAIDYFTMPNIDISF